MKHLISQKRALTALLAALLLGLCAVPAAAASPAPLRLDVSQSDSVVTVTVTATENLSLVSYALKLSWSGAALTLTDISQDCESLGFTGTTTKRDSFGVINAYIPPEKEHYENAAIPSGSSLTTFTLTAAEAPDAELLFTLSVEEAGTLTNGSLSSTAWARATVQGSLPEPPGFCYTPAGSGFTVSFPAAPAAQDRLVAALYTAAGQLKEVKVYSAPSAEQPVAFSAAPAATETVCFFWLDANCVPRRAALTWPEQP